MTRNDVQKEKTAISYIAFIIPVMNFGKQIAAWHPCLTEDATGPQGQGHPDTETGHGHLQENGSHLKEEGTSDPMIIASQGHHLNDGQGHLETIGHTHI